ncbi:flagellar assembly protein FliW [Pseudoflavonifractor sp. 524-17]|uniref:flagellar assembly protein FliW n=1 Tax=Pseudoflavonifractor sp. 524-17 TaxID=2304577 RepID=UPI001379DA5C|nr:flagellar assembly protein FliW [Pseudoflavonifractor sp. 524-17]NCE65511.1 flagellar assembly protein FliW [Pseudoflavonifractor sp. 524-17]
MKLQTKYFGEIDCEAEEFLTFPVGLFGFEEEHKFLLLPFEGSGGTLLCLQSAETPSLAFVVMDPFSLCPGYAPALQPQELKTLGVKEDGDLAFYVLCVVKTPVSDSTVNLKCPVAVNPETRVSRQVILDTDAYHMRHLLAEFGREEDAPC